MNNLDMAERIDLIEKTARRWTENASIEDLKEHYFNEQYLWLESMSDSELLETI